MFLTQCKHILCVLTLALCASLIITPAAAQEQRTEHALRHPTADEYLRALPSISSHMPNSSSTDYVSSDALQRTIGYELNRQFLTLQGASFEALYDAANVVPLSPYRSIPDKFSDPDYQALVITTWLRENNIDLAAQHELHFKTYTLTITPVDFNGDGVPELIVEVRVGNYHDFWVLQRDPTQAIGYRRIKTPIPYFDACGFYAACDGDGQTLQISDLNGDGLPEWVFAIGGECGSGICSGELLVISWRNGELINLAQPEVNSGLTWFAAAGGGSAAIILPPDGTWTFTNDAGVSRIVQRRTFSDNRDCQVTYSNTFTWNSLQDKYVSDALQTTYGDLAGCALRQGENALSHDHYSDAVPFYQRAITLLVSDDPYSRQAHQYAQIRLMLAYALAGQNANAIALENELLRETPESAILQKLLTPIALYANSHDRVQLCSGLNAALQSYSPWDDKSVFWQFAPTADIPNSFNYGGGSVDPNASGCNLEGLLTEMFSAHPLSDERAIADRLTQLGIDTSAHVEIDLNGDGRLDQLYWLGDQPNTALAFISDKDTYRFTLYSLVVPNRYTQFGMIALPGKSGMALVRVGFDEPGSDPEVGDACGVGKPLGSVEIWSIETSNLRWRDNHLLCEPRTIAQVFATPGVLQAWDATDYRGVPTAATSTAFFWDGYKKNYMLLATSSDTHTDTALQCSDQPYEYCGFGLSGIRALAAYNATLEQPSTAPPFFLAAVRYRRALLLESLGKTQAALADYIAISTDYPGTAWALLAELHFCSCMEM